MPTAKPPSSRPSPDFLRLLPMLVAVVLGLGLSLLGADATAQTRATLKVPPEPAGNTILVLDYSNSMWGQIDGVAKIEIARDIIERNLEDWNQSTRLGLIAYGHRRKSDCSDIELVAAPSEQATDDMLAFLADAAPRGRTPLTSALEQAASYAAAGAGSGGGSASLVLLTDGIESCGRDPCAGDTYLNSAAVSQELGHRGLRAMLRADVRSFFVDGAFGSCQIEDQTSQRTYNLAEAAEDQATATVRVGPQFWAIDGDGTAEFGSFTASGDTVSGTEYDSLLVKTTINSTLTDVGGAAGYNLQLSNLPVQVGLGVGVRSIQRTTVASIDGDYTIVTTGEVSDTDFPDHTYTEELTGIYAGPVVRVNYDTALGAKLGAHFGGSLQALYGRSALSARQAFSSETNTFEATDTGFMVGVEAEAGLSYQITPALTLGVGVYGTLTQGAPEVAAAVDPAATEAATQQPSLTGGSWSEMGLKGSISTTF